MQLSDTGKYFQDSVNKVYLENLSLRNRLIPLGEDVIKGHDSLMASLEPLKEFVSSEEFR